MSIDLNRIDAIQDMDEALDALEDFVGELIEEFVESPEGKAYLAAYPEMDEYVGSWIDNLLYFGYSYQTVTLPQMTKRDVEAIVTQLFPRKLSLLEPDEADTAMPELVAFWQFLKRAYQHPQAAKIIKALEKIQPKFKDLMTDPSNFGVAKAFFMAGQAAGYDMTTQAGLEAFQQEYNQKLQAPETLPPMPPELQAMLGHLLPPGLLEQGDVSEADLEQLLGALEKIVGEADDDEGGDRDDFLAPTDDFRQELRRSMWENAAAVLPAVTEAAIAQLTQQPITATAPGSILQDFQTLLDTIGEGDVNVSPTHHLFAAKWLAEFNSKLTHPDQIDLKRPVQKSYPTINGLYLLLRATGLGQIGGRGKKLVLRLQPEVREAWQSLNPTEQYFTLLEAWMVRADEEILGEQRSPLNEGTKCIQFLTTKLPESGLTFKDYGAQQSLNYWPEHHNLALLALFGLVELQRAQPEPGKGWRVTKVQRSPFGTALLPVLVRAVLAHDLKFESATDPTVPFGELQADLQPYFPAWEAVLTLPTQAFRAGMHEFKVSLGKIWRRVAIAGDCTLADLSALILRSVEFDSDHLDQYSYKDMTGRTVKIVHPEAEGEPSTDVVKVGSLPLAIGATMEYVFDFGDWWEFTVQLEAVGDEVRSGSGEVLESYGPAPVQYPD